ncbi:hypothetical protein Ancab_014469 [Ancistrocladus abbreviatus]
MAKSVREVQTGKSSCACRTSNNMKNRSRKLVPMCKSSRRSSTSGSSHRRTDMKTVKKDMGLHRLIFEKGGLPDGTELKYFVHQEVFLTGYKKDRGIMCRCCNSVISASKFEAHAGYASRRKPYDCIYTPEGISLHKLSVSLARKHSVKDSHNPSDSADECASLPVAPKVRRASRVESINHRSKDCTGSVGGFEEDDTKCALCGGYDFTKTGFGPRTMLLCDQCDREYHVGCLKDHKIAVLEELPKGNWFCCFGCRTIYSKLVDLVGQGAQKVPEHLTKVIEEKCKGKSSDDVGDSDVCWQLINDKIAPAEALISEAVNIFKDAFPTISDAEEADLVEAIVNGEGERNKYRGICCAVLTVNSVVKSAVAFRVFGSEVAEFPLFATTKHEHNRGYCRVLFACMEMLLASLNVQKIVLPAAKQAKAMWLSKFGFTKMSKEQVHLCLILYTHLFLEFDLPPCSDVTIYELHCRLAALWRRQAGYCSSLPILIFCISWLSKNGILGCK